MPIRLSIPGRPQEESTPRHTHSRFVASSARRERFQESEDESQITEELRFDNDEESGDDYAEQLEQQLEMDHPDPSTQLARSPHVVSATRGGGRGGRGRRSCTVSIGDRGRFVVGAEGSSTTAARRARKRRKGEDDSWLVKEPVPGGPTSGDVIPSFGGHIARAIWEGRSRIPLKCHVRSKVCGELLQYRREQGADKIWSHGGVAFNSIFTHCLRATPSRVLQTRLTGFLFMLLGATLFCDKSGHMLRPRNIVEAREPGRMHEYSWGSAALAYLYRQLGVASRADGHQLSGCMTLLQAWIYEYFPVFRPHRERHVVPPGSPRAAMWSVRQESRDLSRLVRLRARLDRLTGREVEWLPYGADPYDAPGCQRTTLMGLVRYGDIIEPYMPDRVVRQLGCAQPIPLPITRPDHAYRPSRSKDYAVRMPASACYNAWVSFPRGSRLRPDDYLFPVQPWDCEPQDEYDRCFSTHSHVIMSAGGIVPQGHSDLPDRTAADHLLTQVFRRLAPFFDGVD
ncbi:Protein MAINTENANCE OF MERISTEMS, partial [Bienertia sinuspersici]